MSNKQVLRQFSDIDEIIIDNGASQSKAIDTHGLRGLAILTPESWTNADIAFVAVNGQTANFIYDASGALIAISGIATGQSGVYLAPSGVMALGGFPRLKIASVNTDGSGALVAQGAKRTLHIARLY